MGVDKYGCFMQMYVYYYWNKQSMKSRHVSKVIYVFQRTCSCLLDTWKKKWQVPMTSLFFALSNSLTQPCLHFCRTWQLLLNMQNVAYMYYLLLHLFPSLCPYCIFMQLNSQNSFHGQYKRFSRFGWFFEGKKVAKGVCNAAKLATLCISISPTMGWATGQTENKHCVNKISAVFNAFTLAYFYASTLHQMLEMEIINTSFTEWIKMPINTALSYLKACCGFMQNTCLLRQKATIVEMDWSNSKKTIVKWNWTRVRWTYIKWESHL